MSIDLTILDSDAGGMMADWPDTLTYKEDVSTPIACIVEDLTEGLVLTEDSYLPNEDLRVGVRVSVVGPGFFEAQQTLTVRGQEYRILRVMTSSDAVMFILSLESVAR